MFPRNKVQASPVADCDCGTLCARRDGSPDDASAPVYGPRVSLRFWFQASVQFVRQTRVRLLTETTNEAFSTRELVRFLRRTKAATALRLSDEPRWTVRTQSACAGRAW